MPIFEGRDRVGMFYQWGNHGKRYYYKNNQPARSRAYRLALRQAQAAYANGYRGD